MATGRLRTSGVRLRQDPSTTAAIVGELEEGSPVSILQTVTGGDYEGRFGRSAEWFQVTSNLGKGYVGTLWITVNPADNGPSPLPKPVRGVWIASHRHGNHFDSQAGIETCLDVLQDHGFNTLFPAVFNQSYTAYASAVMQKHGFAAQDPHYAAKKIDPLQTLITLAKPRGMAVLPWFEFGFGADIAPALGPILQQKPEWIALDRQQKPVVYGGLTWMNGFLPEVQEFLIELFTECVATYDVPGVLGDDRCPAMPWNSSYDSTTLGEYRARHGDIPAEDGAQTKWSVFRRELLTQFLARLRQRIKAVKPNALLAISPAPLDWGREKNLQDSGVWMHNGTVDLLLPQLYVNDRSQFRTALRRNLDQFPRNASAKVVAGLHLQPNKRLLQVSDLEEMIQVCREKGLAGISIFHYGYLLSGHQELVACLDQTLASPVA